ncbi:MAG: phospholipase D-like domain-containing protein, partial [Nanoarchaeota archaeon]
DDDYYKKFNASFVKKDSYGLMHNKFCIVDGMKVVSGSMNPTDNDAFKNNNNLLIIDSKVIADNYEDEFQELFNGEFKKGIKVINPKVILDGIRVETYFCPEDDCAYHVQQELKKATESVYFMTFSFTHQGIANELLLKNLDGLEVKGVMEVRQISEYSQFDRLLQNGISVLRDGNKNTMHHKVWLIDTTCVITGSMNPTNNGDTKNDENLLIICDEEIAKQFKEEFDRIYAEAQKTT